MPARGFAGNSAGSFNNRAQSASPGNTPTKEGACCSYNGPDTSDDLLEFFYGHPTSTHKDSGLPPRSKW